MSDEGSREVKLGVDETILPKQVKESVIEAKPPQQPSETFSEIEETKNIEVRTETPLQLPSEEVSEKAGENSKIVTIKSAQEKNAVTLQTCPVKSEDPIQAKSLTELPNEGILPVSLEAKSEVEPEPVQDPVRELLGHPKMTAEDRERKHKELVIKQREAHGRAHEINKRQSPSLTSKNPSTFAERPVPSGKEQSDNLIDNNREVLISSATNFLADRTTQASISKKLQFLKQKGLTEKEIEIAMDRSMKGESSSTNILPSTLTELNPTLVPPSLPPRTYALEEFVPVAHHSPNRVAQSFWQPLSRNEAWKKLFVAFLLTGSLTAALMAAIKKYIIPTTQLIISAQRELYGHQLNLMKKLNERLDSFRFFNRATESTQIPVDDDSSSATHSITSMPYEPLLPVNNTIKEILQHLDLFAKEKVEPILISELLSTLAEFNSYLSKTSHDRNSSVTQIKSEVRGLKGILLSRRNFPRVPTHLTKKQQSHSAE
ncbi:hypothetical protein G9A89_007896 [Geosiphon pyriformis]|nr:hypothetical protein G9A89_007896 [Geosiphon pyriformis]